MRTALELADEPAETRAILDALIQRFESNRAAPWQPGLDRDRMAAMVNAIVGFRIRVRRLDAKFKLSQNRSPTIARAWPRRSRLKATKRSPPPSGCMRMSGADSTR
jgi:predicted FMN-binding regulatory protein PaiB